jgi:hypothetical protein
MLLRIDLQYGADHTNVLFSPVSYHTHAPLFCSNVIPVCLLSCQCWIGTLLTFLCRSLEACTGVAGSGGAKLQQLELSHCKGLTRFHVALIATALPKLQKLTLASCHGIKGKGPLC